MARRTREEQLRRARIALDNALAQNDIQTRLTAFGYNAARLNEGKALLKRATEAVSAQDTLGGVRSESTDTAARLHKKANAAYQDMVNIARAAFRGDERARLDQLGIAGPTPRTVAGLLSRASTFFQAAGATPAIAATLAAFGYDADKLAAERAKFDALTQADAAQEQARGRAQQSTRDQDTALAALSDYLSAFERVARVALKDRPDLLETLAIPARSTPRRRSPLPIPAP